MQVELELRDFGSQVYRFHLFVPDAMGKELVDSEGRRVLCTLPNGRKLQTGLMPTEGGWFLLIRSELVQELGVEEGDMVQVSLVKDQSEYGMDMPEQLLDIIQNSAAVKDAFEALTPGKQRNLIYLVNKVKNPDSRMRKALAIGHHLEEAGTNIDFKRLNELIKHYNNLD